MSDVTSKNGGNEKGTLGGEVKSSRVTSRGIELVLRLRNPGTRALHYISEVRNIQYDPVSKQLTIKMSDEGRTLVPGGMSKLPQFKMIDPNADQLVELLLPDKIVKLATGAPPGDIAFEEHHISEAESITVDVGWADTPFYEDPRDIDDGRMPTVRWQKGSLKVSGKMTRTDDGSKN